MVSVPPAEYRTALAERGFDLEEWLGGGAYGVVYKALQRKLNRPVAVKFFEETSRNPDDRKRFEREALLLARVEHPAIPYVITNGIVKRDKKEVPYTVMQYVAGKTLEQRLATKRMDEAGIHRVMRDLLSALQLVHDNNVVHRDIKPGNIIVSKHGTYLVDFSIGVSIKPEQGLTRPTKLGHKVGTVEYAAPEQMRDSSTVDHRADIYSAAVVLAEMLGARPRLELDRLDLELHRASHQLRDVIRCGAAEYPHERYSTAAEFLTAFEAAMGPAYGGIFDDRMALCPNLKCCERVVSTRGRYYWGPRVIGPTSERFCDSCGTEFIRGCPSCSVPLPSHIASRVSKTSKSDQDALEAHCSRCGTLIFRTPTCECGSYLSLEDIDADQTVCSRCRPATWSTDSDIPF